MNVYRLLSTKIKSAIGVKQMVFLSKYCYLLSDRKHNRVIFCQGHFGVNILFDAHQTHVGCIFALKQIHN